MKISVKLPYEKAEMKYTIWAHEEEKIDFDTDDFRAERCTLSYAAEELVTWLNKAGLEAFVSDKEDGDLSVFIESEGGFGEEFSITGEGKRVYLRGVSRKAALYAVYELLEANDFRWYSPEDEYVPTLEKITLPKRRNIPTICSTDEAITLRGF